MSNARFWRSVKPNHKIARSPGGNYWLPSILPKSAGIGLLSGCNQSRPAPNCGIHLRIANDFYLLEELLELLDHVLKVGSQHVSMHCLCIFFVAPQNPGDEHAPLVAGVLTIGDRLPRKQIGVRQGYETTARWSCPRRQVPDEL